MTSAPEITDAEPIRPGRRLTDGIRQTVCGALNIARGTVGLGASTLCAALSLVLRLVRRERAAEAEPIGYPDGAGEGGGCRRRTPLLIAAAALVLAALGGVAVKVLRSRPADPVAPEPPRVRQFPTADEISSEKAEDDEDGPDSDN